MLAHAGTCWRMLAHAGTCWHMLAHAGTCWHMLAHAGTFCHGRILSFNCVIIRIYWKHYVNTILQQFSATHLSNQCYQVSMQ